MTQQPREPPKARFPRHGTSASRFSRVWVLAAMLVALTGWWLALALFAWPASPVWWWGLVVQLTVVAAAGCFLVVRRRPPLDHRFDTPGERDFHAVMMKTLNQNSHSLVHVKDLDGRYLMINDTYKRVFGVTDEQLLGHTDAVIDPDMASVWQTNDQRARMGLVRMEETAQAPDGLHYFETSKFPVYDDAGRLFATCGISLDVTGLQRSVISSAQDRDVALASVAAKSTFLATMSHEIRTPMNAVIGMTDLLMDTDMDHDQREFVQTVRSSGDALLAVINNVLDFSKIEAGELRTASQPFDLRQEVEGCLELVAAAATTKGLDVICAVEDTCPILVVGDPDRLGQVLTNLLSNAVKFTSAGEITVLVEAAQRPDRCHDLTVRVTDTGIGIPPGALDQLFTSFSQIDETNTREYGGSGLGLAISQRLANAMGGGITVTSTPGSGSSFAVTVVVGEAADQAERAEAAECRAALARVTVLLVDDNSTRRRLLERQLLDLGMRPTAVASSTEALALVEDGARPRLAVVQLTRPGSSGAELAGALRDGSARAAVILLAPIGHKPADAREICAAVLSTPVKSAALRAALRSALRDEPAEQLDGEPASAAVVGSGNRLRVLLAEDNPVNQRVAQLMLAKLGHGVHTVGTGVAAVAAAVATPYDVVLMDLQMPEMDGLEATRLIRAQVPSQDQPRIIAMTASALVEDHDACLAVGMDAFLSKPVRMEDLRRTLGSVQGTPAPADQSAPRRSDEVLELHPGAPSGHGGGS